MTATGTAIPQTNKSLILCRSNGLFTLPDSDSDSDLDLDSDSDSDSDSNSDTDLDYVL